MRINLIQYKNSIFHLPVQIVASVDSTPELCACDLWVSVEWFPRLLGLAVLPWMVLVERCVENKIGQ